MERLTKRIGNKSFISDEKHPDIVNMAYEKLAAYEDAEEQGLLIRLPCKVGDIVYQVIADIYEYTVTAIGIYENKMIICADNKETGLGYSFDANRIGKRYFLTREEAEAALERMNGDARDSI